MSLASAYEKRMATEERVVKITRGAKSWNVPAAVNQSQTSPMVDGTAPDIGVTLENVLFVQIRHSQLRQRDFPAPPLRTDKVSVDGGYMRVRNVYPHWIRGDVVGYRMECEG